MWPSNLRPWNGMRQVGGTLTCHIYKRSKKLIVVVAGSLWNVEFVCFGVMFGYRGLKVLTKKIKRIENNNSQNILEK